MANIITLALGSIALDGIGITLTGRTSIEPLTTAQVNVKKLNGNTFEDLTAANFFLDAGATASAATIKGGTLALPVSFLQTDLLLIQIIDGTEKSDRVSVDFAENYAANTTGYSYEMPAETGKYEMQLLNVNDDDVTATDIVTGDFPLRDATQSAIALPKYKVYLTPLINQVATVDVTLQDVKVLGGDYQVSFIAKQQPVV